MPNARADRTFFSGANGPADLAAGTAEPRAPPIPIAPVASQQALGAAAAALRLCTRPQSPQRPVSRARARCHCRCPLPFPLPLPLLKPL